MEGIDAHLIYLDEFINPHLFDIALSSPSLEQQPDPQNTNLGSHKSLNLSNPFIANNNANDRTDFNTNNLYQYQSSVNPPLNNPNNNVNINPNSFRNPNTSQTLGQTVPNPMKKALVDITNVFTKTLKDLSDFYTKPNKKPTILFHGFDYDDPIFFVRTLERFNQISLFANATSSLYGDKQKPTESVNVFIARKLALFARLDPYKSEELKAALIIEQLRPDLRSRLRRFGVPLTCEELMNTASSVERDLLDENTLHVYNQPKFEAKSNPSVPVSDQTTFIPPLHKQDKNKKPPSPCKYCQQWHYHKDCPKNPFNNKNGAENRWGAGQGQHRSGPANSNPTPFTTHDPKLPRIDIHIFNKTISALMDTGSSINIIRSDLIADFKIDIKVNNQKFVSACGETPTSSGTINLDFSINSLACNSEFILLPKLQEQCILGEPFLKSNNVILDFTRKCAYIERRNQELKKVLRTLLVGKSEKKWDLYLDKALRTLRSRKNLATDMTPARALLGYELADSGEWLTPMYRNNRLKQQQVPPEERILQIKANQSRYQAKYSDKTKSPNVTFNLGDKVMVREMRQLRDPFGPVWSGPFEVVKKDSSLVYTILRDSRLVSIHVNDLRPAPLGNEPPTFDVSESDNDSIDYPDVLDKDLSQEESNPESDEVNYTQTNPQSTEVLLSSFERSSPTHSIECHSPNPSKADARSLVLQRTDHSSDEDDLPYAPKNLKLTPIRPYKPSSNFEPHPVSIQENPIGLRLRRPVKPKTCTFHDCNC
ncbi:unnamed protein product [Ceutorhynchus assimilis]|uniref:Uncharacterized protein n=1 Tax=Ceutorhynchus assimilis TaxID=467358 RepID=A0A9P0DQT9_9CUCU|nr:unnamed protein product [Ceutorhynchus assimilis]